MGFQTQSFICLFLNRCLVLNNVKYLKIFHNTELYVVVLHHMCACLCKFMKPSRSFVHSERERSRGGSNKQRKAERRKSFQHKNPSKQREMGFDTGSTLYPSNLLCSHLPASAITRGATGGHMEAIFAPMAAFLITAFKVLHCNVHGLDVCLVPYMQSYHYPCLLTIAGPVFVTSAALCLGL